MIGFVLVLNRRVPNELSLGFGRHSTMVVFVETSIFTYQGSRIRYKPQASWDGRRGIQHVHKGVQVNLTRLSGTTHSSVALFLFFIPPG